MAAAGDGDIERRIGTQIARAFGSILRKLLVGVVGPWRLERQTSTVSR
jgi:hypothetical protein